MHAFRTQIVHIIIAAAILGFIGWSIGGAANLLYPRY
jgi:hypothetical protein